MTTSSGGNYIVIPRRRTLPTPAVVPASVEEAADARTELLDRLRESFADGILERLFRRHRNRLRVSGLEGAVVPASSELEADDPDAVVAQAMPAVNVLVVSGSEDLARQLRQDPDVELVLDADRKRISPPITITSAVAAATAGGPVDPGCTENAGGLEKPAAPDAPNAWHLDAIGARAAHRDGVKGEGWWIGCVDTGLDISHPEFQNPGRVVQYVEFNRKGQVVPDAVPGDHRSGHGTHVAALAAGKDFGVAPQANLVMARAITDGATSRQVIAALEWLARYPRPDGKTGVDVINLSFTALDRGRAVLAREYISITRQLLKVFQIPVFGAIGNSGPRTHYSPGNYRSVVGIGAIDRQDREWPSSSWAVVGKNRHRRVKPDFVAYGVDLWSAKPGGGYAQKTGTSMATPLGAAMTLLLMQRNRRWTSIRHLVRSHSLPLHLGPKNRHCHKIRYNP